MPAPTLARSNSQAAPTFGCEARFERKLRHRRDQLLALSLGKRGFLSSDSVTKECRNDTSFVCAGPRLACCRPDAAPEELAGMDSGCETRAVFTKRMDGGLERRISTGLDGSWANGASAAANASADSMRSRGFARSACPRIAVSS